jgi:hypothetical protein
MENTILKTKKQTAPLLLQTLNAAVAPKPFTIK